ncbi:MAG: inositol-3-phosphate synthase, partial [Candidatus Marinimicrobia bacterium]|nr:inositol-3-phosphate synthase [Candidatus Neomarinimicrobiota bacterium]
MENVKPKGKLGILIPGMGAVASTFIAGVEAIKLGKSKPIGSMSQMGTIRLGKRTENRTPIIKEFAPLADLNDLVFGGWDINEENLYEICVRSNVLDRNLI